jgi:hypothetical protein
VFKIGIFILVQLESFADEDSTLCLEFTLAPFPSPLEREAKFASRFGCRCPLIHSRMHTSQVQLLGERYVPRLMNGEVLLRSLPSTW